MLDTTKYKKRFTLDERVKIEALITSGTSLRQIALILDRSYTGIKGEVKKGGGISKYQGKGAHQSALERQQRIGHGQIDLTPETINKMRELLEKGEALSNIGHALNVSYTTVLSWVGRHYVVELASRIKSLEEKSIDDDVWKDNISNNLQKMNAILEFLRGGSSVG